MSVESRELSDLRRDTLAAESFLAAEHEAPAEAERVDESDGWPVGQCVCCGERAKIPTFTGSDWLGRPVNDLQRIGRKCEIIIA